MSDNTHRAPCTVPPLVRQRVNAAARECWLALCDLSDCYLSDCDQMPQADKYLFGAATAHQGVQEPLERALTNARNQGQLPPERNE